MTVKFDKPGVFQAHCRQVVWVPLAELLARPRDEQPDTTTTRWDRKLRCEVAQVQCAFETTDRAAYLAHMKDVHGKRTFHGHNAPWAKTIKPWRGPKLEPEGKPWKDPSRSKDPLTVTCTHCGLVAETADTNAFDRWWAEHEAGCRIAQAAS